MSAIDFKEVPSAKGGSEGETEWEQFCEDFFEGIGVEILKRSSRGHDGGLDLLIRDPAGSISDPGLKWLVSCKHYAHGGKAVGTSDEEDVPGRVAQHGVEGFLGFYSTEMSGSLRDKFDGISSNRDFECDVWQKNKIERKLVEDDRLRTTFKRYFKRSYIDYFGNTYGDISLIPMLLLGAWDSGYVGDRRFVAELFRDSAAEYEELLQSWSNYNAFELKREGRTWSWNDREEAWNTFGEVLTDTAMDVFLNEAIDAVTEVHPQYQSDDSRDYNFVAASDDLEFSVDLKSGVIETIWLLQNRAEDISELSQRSDITAQLTREVLAPDNWARWASHGRDVLLLAESHPDLFLDLVEESADDETHGMVRLFEESKRRRGFEHTKVVKALERLAWSDEHVPTVVRMLAKLEICTPEVNTIPSPYDALLSILNGVAPRSNLEASARLSLIGAVGSIDHELGNKLRMDLLPAHGPSFARVWADVPRRDDWDYKTEPRALPAEAQQEFFTGLREQVEEAVQDHPELLGEVLSKYPGAPGLLKPLLESLFQDDALSKQIKESEQTFLVADALRESLNSLLTRRDLETEEDHIWRRALEFYEEIEPESVEARASWLFRRPIVHPEGTLEDPSEESERSGTLRENLIARIERTADPVEKLKLAVQEAREPEVAGSAVAKYSEAFEPCVLLQEFSSDAGENFLSGYFRELGYTEENERITEIYERNVDHGEASKAGLVLRGLEIDEETLEVLDGVPNSHARQFWRHYKVYRRQSMDVPTLKATVEGLQGVGRFECSLLQLQVGIKTLKNRGVDNDDEKSLEPDVLNLITETLQFPIREDSDVIGEANPRQLQYQIEQLHDVLIENGCDTKEIGKIEWAYLPLLRDKKKLVLFDLLETDPSFFAFVIKESFRPDGEVQRGEGNGVQTEGTTRPKEEEWSKNGRLQAIMLLWHHWDGYPSRQDGDNWDDNAVEEWINHVLEETEAAGRKQSGEYEVGRALGRMPVGRDGVWPPKVVREALEEKGTAQMRRGIETGRFNARGVYTGSGGKKERKLSAMYREWAEKVQYNFPATFQFLSRLADTYERQAQREER